MTFRLTRIALRATVLLIASSLAAAADAQSSVKRASSGVARLDTVRVTAEGPRSRLAGERELIRGNRFLIHELKRYDRQIDSLQAHLDSLRLVGARRWKEVRELDSAAVATRDRRVALERRLAALGDAHNFGAAGSSGGSEVVTPVMPATPVRSGSSPENSTP